MPFAFLDGVDLRRTALLNALLDPRPTAPATPAAGQVYFNTTANRPYLYWAGAWHDLLDALTLGGFTPAQLRDRATHTGSQPASTISDFAAAVTAFRLDQFARPQGDLDVDDYRVINLAAPVANSDAATKAYVDAVALGLRDFHENARASADTNVDVATGGLLTIDGVSLDAGDRVLLLGQTTASQNGIWVADAGGWARADDADDAGEVTSGMFLYVSEGDDRGGFAYVLATPDPIALETTPLAFVPFSGGGANASQLEGQPGSFYRDRANHTGTQTRDTIADLYGARLNQWAPPDDHVGMSGYRLYDVGLPLSEYDVATLRTAHEWGQLRWARAATDANVDLAAGGLLTVDGVALADGDRVLVLAQSDPAFNGIYLAHAGSWERAPDATISEKNAPGQLVYITQGTTAGGMLYQLQIAAPPEMGTTALVYAPLVTGGGGPTYSAGNGIAINEDTLAVRADAAQFQFVGGVLTLLPGASVQRYSATIGDGTATVITVPHNLGTRDLTWGVREVNSPYGAVIPGVRFPTVNTIELTFTNAPAAGEFRVTVTA